MRAQILHWLKKHTSDDLRSMTFFTSGGFLFTLGLMTILLANQLLEPSLNQEVVALIGVVFVAVGSIVALWGYLGISLFKLFIYLLEKNHD